MSKILEKGSLVARKLGEISKVEMGQSPDSKYYNSNELGLPLIQGNADIKDRKSINRIWTRQITKQCDAGDIIMTVRAPVGFIGIASGPSCIGRGVCAIKPTEVDKEYMYFLLIFYENSWKAIEQGSTFTAVGSNEILNFPLLIIDSKKKQSIIAEILSLFDSLIEKTQTIIEKYNSIKHGMLHDLFTRGIDIRSGKLRPKYKDAPTLYKTSHLGMIPKEWEVKSLKSLSTQIGDGIHTTPKYSENTNYYFINGNNLNNGNINISDSAFCVSKEEYNKHYKYLNETTILYSINGTIGNAAFYKGENVILGKSVCFVTCKSEIDINYIYYFIQTKRVIKFYERELTGSTIKNLSLVTVRNTPVEFPVNQYEQKLIAERVLTIEKKINDELILLHKLQRIKQGLMFDLLTGMNEVSTNIFFNNKI